AEFAPVFYAGEAFALRNPGPEVLPIPDAVLRACTLRQIAQSVFGASPAGFERLNPQLRSLDTPLPSGAEIRVPDPAFAPLIAARFSAEALARRDALGFDAPRLVKLLVPAAVANATALDTVLARLTLACRPATPVLDALKGIAPPDWMREPVAN